MLDAKMKKFLSVSFPTSLSTPWYFCWFLFFLTSKEKTLQRVNKKKHKKQGSVSLATSLSANAFGWLTCPSPHWTVLPPPKLGGEKERLRYTSFSFRLPVPLACSFHFPIFFLFPPGFGRCVASLSGSYSPVSGCARVRNVSDPRLAVSLVETVCPRPGWTSVCNARSRGDSP